MFEKFNLGPKKEDYPNKKMEGLLFKKAKYKDHELKEKYFVYQDSKLVHFKVSGHPPANTDAFRHPKTNKNGALSTSSTLG